VQHGINIATAVADIDETIASDAELGGELLQHCDLAETGSDLVNGRNLAGVRACRLPRDVRVARSGTPDSGVRADTSIAKKYAAVGRHSHSWRVGFDILDRARDDALKAFSYGYLAHLAADVVAHNAFVPYQLAITSSTTGLGHSYWETRFETHLGDWAPRRARELILLDHSRSDGHLDRILSPTIFSTPTNRRIFRGMVLAADMESWQRVFQLMLERSRWDLADELVSSHLTLAFDYVMDLLIRLDSSDPMQFDPSGHDRLRMAKRIRRSALRAGGEEAVADLALRQFVVPPATNPMSVRLDRPLFPRAAPGPAAGWIPSA
jgi:hypothetical protein